MRRVMRVLLVLSVLIVTSGWSRAGAGSSGAAPTDLQEYLREGALNNPGLRAAFEEWKAALERVTQAEALPDPKFTYAYFIREVETRVGPQRQRVGISQVFPWFGKIEARTGAAAAAAKAARERYQAKKLRLFFEIEDAFHEYAYLAEAIEIAKENLELTKRFEAVALAKYVAAAGSHPDVIRSQMEQARIEDRLKALEGLRRPLSARLGSLLNRDTDQMLAWPEGAKFAPVRVDRKAVYESLRLRSPKLRELDFEAESARLQVELAKKRVFPDLGVGVDWIDTGDALVGSPADSGDDPILLMFSLNLPIWGKSTTAAQMEARAKQRQTLAQKKHAENTLLAETERVMYEIEDSDRKVRLYTDVLIPKAQELLGASETAYKAGTVDFLSLIDAQQRLLAFQLQQKRAIANNRQRLAELETLVGGDVPVVEAGSNGLRGGGPTE